MALAEPMSNETKLSETMTVRDVAEIEMIRAGAVTRPKVVVVIPAYNEERFIGTVVLKAYKHADAVIVVDDGSTDDTAQIATAAGADVVIHEQNQGKGVALNTGFRRARELAPDVVVMIDADGQHVPDEMIFVMQPVLDKRADIVVGSRYLQKESDVPRSRVWGHFFFNFMTSRLSGVSVTDSQSGFRAFSPRALSVIWFNSPGFSVESEIQLLAREHDLLLKEVPISILYHDKPKRSVVGQGLSVLSGLLRLTGQYRPLLFFGVPGVFLLLAGLAWGMLTVEMYRTSQSVPVEYPLLSALLLPLGALSLFAGIILHSVRGLLLDLDRSRNNHAEGKSATQPSGGKYEAISTHPVRSSGSDGQHG